MRAHPDVPEHTVPVHTCGEGCRTVDAGKGAGIDHYGWPADYKGPVPQLGCGLVCVPGWSCGGCPKGTPFDPVDAQPVHPLTGPIRAHECDQRCGSDTHTVWHRGDNTPPVAESREPAPPVETPRPPARPACTCDAGTSGRGHLLRCAIYA